METVRTLVHEGLKSFGWLVRKYSWKTDPFARRAKMLRATGINTAIDVGANLGSYRGSLRRAGFAGRIISIEPLTGAYSRLKKRADADGRWETVNMAAGDRRCEALINVSANSVFSSLLPMTETAERSSPSAKHSSSYTVQCATLDEVVAGRLSQDDRVFLKMDTQGYEDRVLKGATRVLSQTHLVECELSMVTLYEGQLLFEEMLDLFKGLGLRAVLFEPAFSDPTTGFCLQLDAPFAVEAAFRN